MNTIISFGLCPFVQRSLITMNYKKIPYEVKYIDLENKPDWFLAISPMGKVPLLKVGNEILFESAVINEYIDEVSEGSLLLSDPLQKAKERAYIELASSVTMSYFQAATAEDEESYTSNKEGLEKGLTFLLNEYKGPFFRGNDFSLVDTSAVPALQRLTLTNNLRADLGLSDELFKKLDQWLESTLSMEEVKKSVPENFAIDYNEYLVKRNSYIHQRS
jgi:glutathione S-transferase